MRDFEPRIRLPNLWLGLAQISRPVVTALWGHGIESRCRLLGKGTFSFCYLVSTLGKMNEKESAKGLNSTFYKRIKKLKGSRFPEISLV